jgi:lysophospholipase L1-like esterase
MKNQRGIKSFFGSFFSKKVLLFLALAVCCAASPLPQAARPYSRMDLPWWRERFEAKAAALRSHQADLVWYGDSITQDFELTGPEPWRNFRPTWDRFYASRNAINLGFKGDATAHLLWRIEHGEADGISPRLAIVLIGANNFGHLHWPAEPTLVGIEAVIASLHRHLPRTPIILLGVLPSIRSAWVDENTVELNRDLAARYGKGADPLVTFKDLSYLFVEHGHVAADRFLDPRLTPPDPPLHPSAEVQAQIAEAIEPEVSRLMGDRIR